MIGISRTLPFRDFQLTAGLSTFNVNTVAIGLELIATGGQKPSGMNVTWTPPKKPREAVEQTKHFALFALMTLVVAAFDTLLRDYVDVDWLDLPLPLQEILRKAVTKPGGVEWAIHERVQQLLTHLFQTSSNDSLALLELMVSWRNALVHSRKPRLHISEKSSEVLQAKRGEFSQMYAGIDTLTTLENFRSKKWPTLKEATTMIAVTQNLARLIDEALIERYAGHQQQIQKIAKTAIVKALPDLPGGWKKVWGRDVEARTRFLSNQLSHVGIVEANTIKSANLPATFVEDLAKLERSEIENMIHGELSAELSPQTWQT
jgi:hypothetical protein